ncbi:unnamed protein product [Absidia cylindrospora]
MNETNWDVIVVGGGNAGYSAALSAKMRGAKNVLIIEKSRQANDYRGGNTYCTAGAFRTVFHGLKDLQPILHELDDETAALIDMEPYTYRQFYDDVMRVTSGRADPTLTDLLVSESRPTIHGLHNLVFNSDLASIDRLTRYRIGTSFGVAWCYLR